MLLPVLFKGMAVGLAVAAPVGPIGLLCIRRTLADGRATGFAVGLGAAVADATYGLMVAAGLALTGLLLSHALELKILGGLLLCYLGALSLRQFLRPKKGESKAAEIRRPGLLPAFFSTFLLTLANPATILSFVGLVSGLSVSAAEHAMAPFILVLGVFLGSALWWLILVHITLAAKSKLSATAIGWIDALSGALLLGWGLWLLIDAFAAIV